MPNLLTLLGNVGQVAGAAESTYARLQDLQQKRQLAALSAAEARQRMQAGQMQMQRLQQQMTQDAQQLQRDQQIAALGGQVLQQLGGGFPQVPAGQPGPGMPTAPTGGPPPVGAGQPAVPAGPGAPQTNQPASLFGPPDTPTGYSVSALARGIKRLSPQADDATVFQTVGQIQHLLAPDAKMELQRQMVEFKQNMAEERLHQGEERLGIQRDNLDIRQEVAGLRAKLLEKELAGDDPRQNQKHQQRLEEIAARAGEKNPEMETAKADINDAKAEFQNYDRKVKSLMQENGGLLPGPGSPRYADLDKALKGRAAANDKVQAVQKKYDDLIRRGKTKAASAAPQQGAQPPALPQEAVQQLEEGHVTTFGNGQKWTLQNGQPVQVE